jgi:hypothetical protein
MQLGIAMNGLEERVLDITKGVAAHFNEITYVEIGVGEGTTLTAIARTLKDSGKKWRAIGIELVNGYSFNLEHTRKSAAQREVNLNFVTPNGSIVHPLWETVTIYFKDSQGFLTEIWQEPIHFALIDGCHGKPCVILDFLALEAFMAPNGVVMFHDFSQDQVGQAQPHCIGGIDVRGACQDLGLTNGKRANWKFDETLIADRTKGGWDMAIFKKIT